MPANSMDEIVSLCKRRGFIFQSSDIYGGLQGIYDYGPLGVELKNNLKAAWWRVDGVRPRRRRRSRRGDPDELQSAALFRPRGHVLGPVGGLPQVQEPLARRPSHREEVSELRLGRSHRAAPVQSDVQDHRRPCGRRQLVRVSAARDRAGDVHQLQTRARFDVAQAAVRHRADRQGVPQRNHAAQLHLPRARIRTDGTRVLRQARHRRSVAPSNGSRTRLDWWADQGVQSQPPATLQRAAATNSRIIRRPPST